jgi:hypothetical protein
MSPRLGSSCGDDGVPTASGVVLLPSPGGRLFRACMILVGCPPGSRPPRQSSGFTAYSWKGGAIVAHVEPSLPSQHQLEMMLATPKSVGLPLSQIWKGGERASHVSMFSFLILETETSFRFLFWERKPVSMMSFLILETETISVSYFGNGNRFP